MSVEKLTDEERAQLADERILLVDRWTVPERRAAQPAAPTDRPTCAIAEHGPGGTCLCPAPTDYDLAVLKAADAWHDSDINDPDPADEALHAAVLARREAKR